MVKCFEMPTKDAMCLYSKPKSKSASNTSNEGRMSHACTSVPPWGPHDTIPQVPPPSVPPRRRAVLWHPTLAVHKIIDNLSWAPHYVQRSNLIKGLSLASIVSCPNVSVHINSDSKSIYLGEAQSSNKIADFEVTLALQVVSFRCPCLWPSCHEEIWMWLYSLV